MRIKQFGSIDRQPVFAPIARIVLSFLIKSIVTIAVLHYPLRTYTPWSSRFWPMSGLRLFPVSKELGWNSLSLLSRFLYLLPYAFLIFRLRTFHLMPISSLNKLSYFFFYNQISWRSVFLLIEISFLKTFTHLNFWLLFKFLRNVIGSIVAHFRLQWKIAKIAFLIIITSITFPFHWFLIITCISGRV